MAWQGLRAGRRTTEGRTSREACSVLAPSQRAAVDYSHSHTWETDPSHLNAAASRENFRNVHENTLVADEFCGPLSALIFHESLQGQKISNSKQIYRTIPKTRDIQNSSELNTRLPTILSVSVKSKQRLITWSKWSRSKIKLGKLKMRTARVTYECWSYLDHTLFLQPSADHTSFQSPDIHPTLKARLGNSLWTAGWHWRKGTKYNFMSFWIETASTHSAQTPQMCSLWVFVLTNMICLWQHVLLHDSPLCRKSPPCLGVIFIVVVVIIFNFIFGDAFLGIRLQESQTAHKDFMAWKMMQ